MKKMMRMLVLAATFAAGFATRSVMPGEAVAHAQARPRVYELRTYTAVEGKLDALHARFRDHILGFFQKHGMTNVVYFKPMDAPLSQNSMTYMIAFPSRDAAKKSWDSFRADQEWTKVAAASGVGQVKIDSVYFEPTDYSPLK